jgi:tellurite resistance protein
VTPQLSPQEALIYAMVTTAAVDRQINEEELARISSIVRELPAFANFNGNWLMEEAQDCGRILGKPEGVRRVLDLVKAALPEHLRETAFALSAEVAASDLAIKAEETDFLSLLGNALELDALVMAALARGARARHRSLRPARA